MPRTPSLSWSSFQIIPQAPVQVERSRVDHQTVTPTRTTPSHCLRLLSHSCDAGLYTLPHTRPLRGEDTHGLSLEALDEDAVEEGLERADRLEGSGLRVSVSRSCRAMSSKDSPFLGDVLSGIEKKRSRWNYARRGI